MGIKVRSFSSYFVEWTLDWGFKNEKNVTIALSSIQTTKLKFVFHFLIFKSMKNHYVFWTHRSSVVENLYFFYFSVKVQLWTFMSKGSLHIFQRWETKMYLNWISIVHSYSCDSFSKLKPCWKALAKMLPGFNFVDRRIR